MSRAATGDTVVVKPASNIYTVMLLVSTLVTVAGLVVLIMRARSMFPPDGLF